MDNEMILVYDAAARKWYKVTRSIVEQVGKTNLSKVISPDVVPIENEDDVWRYMFGEEALMES